MLMLLNYIKPWLVVTGMLLLAYSTFASDSSQYINGWGARVHSGEILIHTNKIQHFDNALTGATEVSYLWQTTGKYGWGSYYNYPTIGVSAMFINYGNNNLLGHVLSLYPHITFDVVKRQDFSFQFRGGAGLSYMTQPYQAVENRNNRAIGSRINNFIYLGFHTNWTIHPQWKISTGLTFTHNSNAAYSSPNLGINLPAISVGMEHYFDKIEPAHFQKKAPTHEPSFHIGARIGLGMEESAIPNGPKYPIYSLSLNVNRKINAYNKLSLGIYSAFHYGIYETLQLYNSYPDQQRKAATRVGIEIGDEFLFHNVGIIGKVGAYLHNPIFQFDPVYTRVGCKYYFFQKHLYTGVYLKAHRFIADYGEFTIGINL